MDIEQTGTVAAPFTTGEPVTFDEVEGQCRITDLSLEFNTVSLFITAVRKRGESITRRALIPTTEKLVLDEFPSGRTAIELPKPPLKSIVSITYIDSEQNTIVLNPSLYRMVNSESEKCQPGFVIPVYGEVWPVALNDFAVVTIEYTCGYELDACPAPIKQWILLNVSDLYEHRETIQVGNRLTAIELKTLGDSLIADYRITRL